eukprot:46096-Amphidinium_carterae.2
MPEVKKKPKTKKRLYIDAYHTARNRLVAMGTPMEDAKVMNYKRTEDLLEPYFSTVKSLIGTEDVKTSLRVLRIVNSNGRTVQRANAELNSVTFEVEYKFFKQDSDALTESLGCLAIASSCLYLGSMGGLEHSHVQPCELGGETSGI